MKKIFLVLLAFITINLAQDVKTDSTLSKKELLKKYEQVIREMKDAKLKRYYQLTSSDPEYNRLDAIDVAMQRLIKELNDNKVGDDKNKK